MVKYDERLDHHSEEYDPEGWAEQCEQEMEWRKENSL